MPNPDLAAMIAAVRWLVEYADQFAVPTPDAIAAIAGSVTALRTLEALADRDRVGLLIRHAIYPEDTTEDWWRIRKHHKDFLLEQWRKRGDEVVAALLARAGGGDG